MGCPSFAPKLKYTTSGRWPRTWRARRRPWNEAYPRTPAFTTRQVPSGALRSSIGPAGDPGQWIPVERAQRVGVAHRDDQLLRLRAGFREGPAARAVHGQRGARAGVQDPEKLGIEDGERLARGARIAARRSGRRRVLPLVETDERQGGVRVAREAQDQLEQGHTGDDREEGPPEEGKHAGAHRGSFDYPRTRRRQSLCPASPRSRTYARGPRAVVC